MAKRHPRDQGMQSSSAKCAAQRSSAISWRWTMISPNNNWLVVLTILKNISQWEGLSHILWKIKMFETNNQNNKVIVMPKCSMVTLMVTLMEL